MGRPILLNKASRQRSTGGMDNRDTRYPVFWRDLHDGPRRLPGAWLRLPADFELLGLFGPLSDCRGLWSVRRSGQPVERGTPISAGIEAQETEVEPFGRD